MTETRKRGRPVEKPEAEQILDSPENVLWQIIDTQLRIE